LIAYNLILLYILIYFSLKYNLLFNSKLNKLGARGRTQMVEHLPRKCKALSSNLHTARKKKEEKLANLGTTTPIEHQLKSKLLRARGMAQVVEQLPCTPSKHKGLSSNLAPPKKKKVNYS
jgi:hypothetical protein